ncbi:conserved protein of unknown function [Petrocella atlantisensis]|uniref:Regulatory protein YycH-like domain-containing protein n=1 Tax=Petrocella atlantisensis TaxID=2173034 RepID=A0A3P7RZW5_9FIRM|nr:hypothetical protein [Petrocella atlantisensis]VDN48052.1 conserved protein of unknown function [Petrocella atlantisensis]
MNMQKMLNGFIMIFLIINLGLFLFIYQRDVSRHTLSGERIDQLERILEKNDIYLLDHLPDFHPKSKLRVSMPVDIEKELVEVFFQNEEVRFTISANAHTHETAVERLTFDQVNEKGRVFYGSNEPTFVPKNLLGHEKLKSANDFVDKMTLGKGKYELTDQRDGDVFSIYYYNERFLGELIFSNETVVRMEEKGITEARAIRYVPQGFVGNPLELFPADEALYKFMSYIRAFEDTTLTITDFDLGYAIGQSPLENVIWMEIEPYYRIKLSTGQTYFINAYTNEIYRP